MKTLWILFFLLGFGSIAAHAQIFTDSRPHFSYTDDSTVMPGDVKVLDILFEANCRYYLEYNDTLLELANFLLKHPNIQVLVTVYTDLRGSISSNQKLSECRAEGIARFLKSKGITGKQCNVQGKGEEEPLIPEETIAAEPDEETRERYHRINRRTEVKIITTDLKMP